MKRLCGGCGEKPVYVARAVSPEQYEGKLKGHDLCGKCYRSFRSADHAARMTPKPYWAERSTLSVLAQQGQLRFD
jgi:hypothetical protein